MLVADLEEAMKIDAGISGKRTSSVKGSKIELWGWSMERKESSLEIQCVLEIA